MLLVDKVAFGYALDQPILADITFAVGGGEVLAIVGRNGAGKSTLLRLLNGLLQPAAGRISVNGNATSTTPVHRLARDIGTVFQAPEQQIFHPTVGAEIAFGPRQIGVRGAALAERVTQTLARVGLTAAAARHPLDLDAAALRFVALGSVLAMRPSILLLDEPQRGLDAGSLRRLEQIVADEAAAGTAVLLVCHDMDFVARRASRVLALAGGRIAADRSTTAFFTDAALVQRVGVEVPDPAQLAERLGLPPQCTPATVAQAWIAQVISRRPDPTP